MSVADPEITGVILAGGLGRRMGGVDKGLQELDGQPMVAWVLGRLRPQVSGVLINANQNLDAYRAFGCPVVSDRIAGFAGPLAGLHAALSAGTGPLVLTVPCDSPFLPADLAARLLAALQEAEADIAVAKTLDQLHPVFCLCRREVLPSLSAYLEGGERKFERWLATCKVVLVSFDDEVEAFSNINTGEDLRRLSRGPA
jgi:molybdopterin-guanine dinucleotide biosynthesis protein A